MIDYKIEIGKKEKDILVDITLSSKIYVKKRRLSTLLALFFGIFFLISGIFFLLIDSPVYSAIVLIPSLFFFAYFLGLAKKIQRFLLNMAMKKMDPELNSGTREYLFDNEGVQVISSLGNGNYYWTAFIDWGTMENYIYIQRIDSQIILINQDDLSREELSELTNLLQNVKKSDN